MATGGDLANQGAWGQAHGSAPLLFIAGTLGGATSSIFGNASNGGTDASVTTINHFDVTAASTDTLQFQAAMWSGNGTANNIGGLNIALTDIGISALVAAGDAVNPDLITTSGQATAYRRKSGRDRRHQSILRRAGARGWSGEHGLVRPQVWQRRRLIRRQQRPLLGRLYRWHEYSHRRCRRIQYDCCGRRPIRTPRGCMYMHRMWSS